MKMIEQFLKWFFSSPDSDTEDREKRAESKFATRVIPYGSKSWEVQYRKPNGWMWYEIYSPHLSYVHSSYCDRNRTRLFFSFESAVNYAKGLTLESIEAEQAASFVEYDKVVALMKEAENRHINTRWSSED